MTVYLETPRLLLREFTEDDADLLFELDSDPAVMRFLGPRLADREAYRDRIATVYRAYYASGRGVGVWAAAEKPYGVFLGWFCLRPGLDYRFAREVEFAADDLELGYRLRHDAWNKGYATELARALVEKGFRELGAVRIVAAALVGNRGSTRVMEKVGLRRVGEFAVPGYDMATVKYALTREEFQASVGPR
jgi:RimJ/RimL family protein N-acetyltransferase